MKSGDEFSSSSDFSESTSTNDIESKNSYNTDLKNTLLDYVYDDNYKKLIKLMQSKKVDINKSINGLTLLHWAAQIGALNVTKALLDNKADPSILDSYGYTALEAVNSKLKAFCSGELEYHYKHLTQSERGQYELGRSKHKVQIIKIRELLISLQESEKPNVHTLSTFKGIGDDLIFHIDYDDPACSGNSHTFEDNWHL